MSASEILEISGEQVAKLNDADLRELVARLCEAELRRCGLPGSTLTAGGSQDAADAGIDVRVALESESSCLDFIPKAATGFQVKASDMAASAISAEMRPGGTVRASIKALADAKGAYVMVCSKGSVTDRALADRVAAMRKAVSDVANNVGLLLDFYDRNRLATWARGYHGVALWLRERIGEPLRGWRGYGNWAPYDQEGSEFLLDDVARITPRNSQNNLVPRNSQLPIVQGIEAMRRTLQEPKGVVRLVGLSGLGKTRLTQALFDRRVGKDALDPALVLYADQGAGPDPSARDLVHRVVSSGRRAIFVIDNCNPATHRALVELINGAGSKASLITVEYDVASDDEPEDTDVFQLGPSSDAVLEKILGRLAPGLSSANAGRIVEFAGGNARIALALAKTLRGGESLGTLNDAELFRRLFVQGQQDDPTLMRAGEVFALVYSFNGEEQVGDTAELPVLAELAGLNIKELFRALADLRSRDLVQARGKWRAVLPHAIANRLALLALGRFSTESLMAAFNVQGRERLLKSFSRRLGYLHTSERALDIARRWLSDPDFLGNPLQFNDVGIALFENIVPLLPELALSVMERAAESDPSAFFSNEGRHRQKWIHLTRALAYEEAMFARAAMLLARWCSRAEKGENDYACSNFVELFHLFLSGTRATIDKRIELTRTLLSSSDEQLQRCGISALNGLMESGHFSSSHNFGFGSRPRDFGWRPETYGQIDDWYRKVLRLAEDLGAQASPHRAAVKDIVARHIRSLWNYGRVNGELAALVRALAAEDGWPQGWIAVRMTLKYQRSDRDQLPAGSAEALQALAAELQPRDFGQRLDAYVLTSAGGTFEISAIEEDGTEAGWRTAAERAYRAAVDVGREAVLRPDLESSILPRVLRKGQGRQRAFGEGLGLGSVDRLRTWEELCRAFFSLAQEERSVEVLCGYLAQLRKSDPALGNSLLDSAANNTSFDAEFPLLNGCFDVDEEAAARLSKAAKKGMAKAWTYRNLSFGRQEDTVSPATFRRLVNDISTVEDGFPVAIDLLGMRLYILKVENLDSDTFALARELVPRCGFDGRDANLDYHVGEVIRACFRGPQGAEAAKAASAAFVAALGSDETGAWTYINTAQALFEVQPEIALDAFLDAKDRWGRPALRNIDMVQEDGPVNRVPFDLLQSWAQRDFAVRLPWLAENLRLFIKGPDESFTWTPAAHYLLQNAPDRAQILSRFARRLSPTSWSGSRADALTPRLKLLDDLAQHPQPDVREWASREKEAMRRSIERERELDRNTDASFEPE